MRVISHVGPRCKWSIDTYDALLISCLSTEEAVTSRLKFSIFSLRPGVLFKDPFQPRHDYSYPVLGSIRGPSAADESTPTIFLRWSELSQHL